MNLLVTGAWREAKENIKALKDEGHCVYFMQFEEDKLNCDYEWVEGVICNSLFLSHPIELFSNLRYIQLTSAGFDRVPMDYVRQHNITIHNAKGVYSVPMAEFAVFGVLSLYKRMIFFWKNQQKHVWKKNRKLLELQNKIVCIVGCGDVGSECAKRFRVFGCKVIGVNRTMIQKDEFDIIYSLSALDEVIPQADILVLTLPDTRETNHIIDEKKICSLKSSSIIVNIARGGVVDMAALTENIGKIGGAVLDVFEDEPLNKNSPLWDAENVIITPHNSFVSDGNAERLKKIIFSNLMR